MDNISTYPKDWYKQITGPKKKPRTKQEEKVSDDKKSDTGSRKSSKDEGAKPSKAKDKQDKEETESVQEKDEEESGRERNMNRRLPFIIPQRNLMCD